MINELLNKFVETFKINKNTNNKGLDEAYEILAGAVAFKRSPYFVHKNSWNNTGSRDGKIDGYDVIGNENIIQIKTMQAKNTTGINSTKIRDFLNSVKHYVMNIGTILTGEFSSLKNLREIIISNKTKYPRATIKYELYLVCQEISNERAKQFQTEFDAVINNNPNVAFKIITNKDIEKIINNLKTKIYSETFNKAEYKITLGSIVTSDVSGGTTTLVSTIKAKDVVDLINNEFIVNFDLKRLFHGNVRGFLGDTAVNSMIKYTIDNKPNDFLKLNNGAVVVCDEIRYIENNDYVLINPVVVNGQQTFASIYKYAGGDSKQEKIKLPIKIVSVSVDKDSEMEEIAKASNQANTIKDIDLLSNKPLMKKIRNFLNENGYFVKYKTGETLNEILFTESEAINFSDLLKVWVSYELEFPSRGKTTQNNIKMFSDAYSVDKKGVSSRLIVESNFEKLSTSLLSAANIMKLQPLIKEKFQRSYYDHAQYFILYLFKIKFGAITEQLIDERLEEIATIIDNQILLEQNRKKDKGKEYTHNNYFKSVKPVLDYLETNWNFPVGEKLAQLLPNNPL